VNRCVPAERLDQEIDALTAAIVSKPPSVIAAGKALFYAQLERGIMPAFEIAGQAMARSLVEDIAQEGVAAFLEKRPPKWSAERD